MSMIVFNARKMTEQIVPEPEILPSLQAAHTVLLGTDLNSPQLLQSQPSLSCRDAW